MSAKEPKEVLYRIRRFNPEKDDRPRWEEHRVEYSPGLTVLDGLWLIKEKSAPGLAWRASCRMGVCGSCGMMINGKPRLACNTQITELGTDVVTVAPLPNFAITRDLVPDLGSMFEKHLALSPFLIRPDEEEQENPRVEYRQTSEEMERYLQFSYCIKCGCCMAACPTRATEAEYPGPMPLTQAHRYNSDTRDAGFATRKEELTGGNGPWRCHFAGECSRVCPKGVDPAKAIQLMKRDLVLDLFRLRRKRSPAPLVEKPEGIQRREDIPHPPPRTIESG